MASSAVPSPLARSHGVPRDWGCHTCPHLWVQSTLGTQGDCCRLWCRFPCLLRPAGYSAERYSSCASGSDIHRSFASTPSPGQPSMTILDKVGRPVGVYTASHALVVGFSNYKCPTKSFLVKCYPVLLCCVLVTTKRPLISPLPFVAWQ